MRRTRWLVATGALLVTMVACGGGDDATSTDADTTSPPDATTTTVGASTTAAPPTQPDPCGDALVLAGTGTPSDGTFNVATAWADQGPHPANTVDYDRSFQLALATYEVPVDEQFGPGVPVGVPEVPEGGLILTATMSVPPEADPVGVGTVFGDPQADDFDPAGGSVLNVALFGAGGERIGPLVGTTVTITELTDERACGTLEMTASTDVQQFPTLTGTFVADRLQFLEAEG